MPLESVNVSTVPIWLHHTVWCSQIKSSWKIDTFQEPTTHEPVRLNEFEFHLQCDAIRWEPFCGDVVLDSFNVVYSDEDSI